MYQTSGDVLFTFCVHGNEQTWPHTYCKVGKDLEPGRLAKPVKHCTFSSLISSWFILWWYLSY